MKQGCGEVFPRIDAFLDGELPEDGARDVMKHLAGCAPCSGELESRRALKRALRDLQLPEAPAVRLSRPRWARWFAAAAALLVAVLVFFSVPAPVPEVAAASSRLHDEFLEGRLTRGELGLKVSIPGADFVGRCACPPALGDSVPFISYNKGGTPISLLILELEPGLPSRDLKVLEGPGFRMSYWHFRAGRNSVLVCPKGGLTQIWVSRLDEEELGRAVQATRMGQAFGGGERVTLDELS